VAVVGTCVGAPNAALRSVRVATLTVGAVAPSGAVVHAIVRSSWLIPPNRVTDDSHGVEGSVVHVCAGMHSWGVTVASDASLPSARAASTTARASGDVPSLDAPASSSRATSSAAGRVEACEHPAAAIVA
jgi:hypothetical protein